MSLLFIFLFIPTLILIHGWSYQHLQAEICLLYSENLILLGSLYHASVCCIILLEFL